MLPSIQSASDLETTHSETQYGFLDIALRKAEEAQYYLELSNQFRLLLNELDGVHDLVNNDELKPFLYQASGISSKAQSHLADNELMAIVEEFLSIYIVPFGDSYVDLLVSRFLLNSGDALGGKMRNIIGKKENEVFSNEIVQFLKDNNMIFSFLNKGSKIWYHGHLFEDMKSENLKGLQWTYNGRNRILLFDVKVPVVKKNVDFVLLENEVNSMVDFNIKECLLNSHSYIVLGELKGGIDPAGADEHWKTAKSSLNRIRNAFEEIEHPVETVFVGAAIQSAMAEEMYNRIQDGLLTICANLTKSAQLSDLVEWVFDQ